MRRYLAFALALTLAGMLTACMYDYGSYDFEDDFAEQPGPQAPSAAPADDNAPTADAGAP
jgi:hypothetical protein